MRTLGALLGIALTSTLLAGPAAAAPAQVERHDRPGQSAGDHHGGKHRFVPTVVGHRGASGYRPEHTLAAYALAIRQGADYIEPDLVSTKDGVLVARHENEIGGTTDVAEHPEFADRRTTKVIDGVSYTGWFTEDFTLAELRTLRAVERLPAVRPQNTVYDGRYRVPTFAQVLRLAKAAERVTGRTIGVFPETKHPTYFDSIGLSLEEPLLRDLRAAGLDRKRSKVIIQSFESGNLAELSRRTQLPLVRLITPAQRAVTAPASLKALSRYVDGIGPDKSLVLPLEADGSLGAPTTLVRDAHKVGLTVTVYTLRRENQFMATDFRRGTDPNAYGDMAAEARAFLDAGVDGYFTDNPDVGVAARDAWVRDRVRR